MGHLAAGDYTVSGTDPDAHGDTGTWSYTLDVTPVTMPQVAATTGTATPATRAPSPRSWR